VLSTKHGEGRQAQIVELRQQLAEAQRLIVELRQQLAEAQRLIVELRQQRAKAQQLVDALQTRERRLSSELASNNSLLGQTAKQSAKWRDDYQAVISSRSWRITRPLRAIAGRLRRLRYRN
jgi:chromosome segregation ATPase